jgi:hypothetical protein
VRAVPFGRCLADEPAQLCANRVVALDVIAQRVFVVGLIRPSRGLCDITEDLLERIDIAHAIVAIRCVALADLLPASEE